MYFVPDGTERCGFYECKKCGLRFLDWRIGPTIACPDCDGEIDMEMGPDDDMAEASESAVLLQMIDGAEEVERMDALLSLALTGGDYDWI